MSEATGEAKSHGMIPILEYVFKTYLADAKMPQGEETTSAKALIGEISKIKTDKKIKDKTSALIEFKRGLTPFKRFILDCTTELQKINTEVQEAIAGQNAQEMSRGYFRVASLLMKLKLWRDSNLPPEKMEPELEFSDHELQFLDHMLGIDLPFTSAYRPYDPPIVNTRENDADRRQLVRNGQVVDENYEEPLRIQMRDHVKKNYGIERVGDFAGTKQPRPSGEVIKNVKAKEIVEDIVCFRCLSQFLKYKYKQLRTSTYRPLDVERKESGGYRQKRIYFKEEGGGIAEVPKSNISVEMHYMDPNTISNKLVTDISLQSQTLTMGSKKIDNEYFFNIFFHIQQMFKLDDDEAAAVEKPDKFERFEPSETDDFHRHRDRISAEKAMELVSELCRCDQYVFGGNLDLDVYLDGIGIRKKPNIMMTEGEGLACFDYINNLILVPTICPPKVTPIDQIVSALADFRYALWIDTPKDIFDQQGVGFQIIGSKSRSRKPLWGIFPTHCSALIKQRSFRDQYKRHVLSFLYQGRISHVAGFEVPTTNRISDSKLRQYFNAYVPLAEIKPTGVPTGFTESERPAPAPDDDAPETEAAAPEPKKAEPEAKKPAPPPKPKAPPQPAAEPPKPESPKASDEELPAAVGCKNCGKSLPPNSKFCLNCGAPVEVAFKCSKCGAALPPGSKFCNECGTPVS